MWISEHVAFTRAGGIDLGHLNPVPASEESLAILSEHVAELRARCRKPVVLENIATHLHLGGGLGETEFLNRLCEEADCGLLLDVTNLYVNSRNHRFDPLQWVRELDPEHIVQLHVVGYETRNGRHHDTHATPVQPEILELLMAVVDHAPVQACIIERDDPGCDRRRWRASCAFWEMPLLRPEGLPWTPALAGALARLLSSRGLRAALRADPHRCAATLGLAGEGKVLSRLPLDDLDAQGEALLAKRFHEVARLLPGTVGSLGAAAREHFDRYAETHWPAGHGRHREDAVAFGRALRASGVVGVDGAELNRIRFQLEGRRSPYTS